MASQGLKQHRQSWQKYSQVLTSISPFSLNVLYSFQKQISILHFHLFRRLQTLSIWTSPKICPLVKSSFPRNKILALSKLKGFADHQSNVLVTNDNTVGWLV